MEINGILYLVNEKEKTAIIVNLKDSQNLNDQTNFIIPHAIEHESNEYIITSISQHAFSNISINSLKCTPNSEIKTFQKFAFVFTRIIGTSAFSYSNIESIKIPSSVKYIDEYAFSNCSKLSEYIPVNSELEMFCKGELSGSLFSSLFIPQYVTKIDEYVLNVISVL